MRLRGALREKIDKLKGKGKVKYPLVKIKEPKHLIVFPSIKKMTNVDIKYPLLEPFVYARIKWNPEKRGLVYNIIEPILSKKEVKILETIKKDLLETIDVELSEVKEKGKTFEYIQKKLTKILEDENIALTSEGYVKISYYIYRNFVGFNEIEGLLHDPYIEDIGCPGLGIPVFVVHRKFGSTETNIVYEDSGYLNNFVIKLAERCGRYVSYAKPLLDGSLPDGSRVQATLAKDVTTKGPTFSIRKFRIEPFSPIDIINLNTASSELMAYLWTVTEARASTLICGGVSSGKTTFLNSISMFIPPEDKIVSIEDTRELNLPHENWIPSVSRIGFGIPEASGKRYGEVTLFELLKESFRQNPDYVIVGEVRGKEAYVMFQGMASGHSSIGTIHAGSIEDVIKRLETPPIELSPSLVETLDIVIVMVNAKEKGKSARRVKNIVEIESVDPKTGNPHTIKTFDWIPSTDSFGSNLEESYLLKRIAFDKGMPYEKMKNEIKNRVKILEWMRKFAITDYREVCKLVNLYYKETSIIMEWVNRNLPPYKTKAKEVKKILESSTGLGIIE
ncbi:MAG: secretion system protein E [Candidatus Aenigmarchaeota archaeon]|nr:secretion system protein E [Candidatus Aenigmarchaeota archaeon]NIP39929.1 secretion system protein E [Candidatus Aenigmarchaeota archaeon]NIQ17648.1 secretion system protein E [Candidatus Aenigmarchaeota archaeon]NIS72836.1 secretion system protein E [Candidatus Aenigmarchaeota archaeon]